MDKILELELRQSECRQELADLLEKDADSEQVGSLTGELRQLDKKIMAHKLTKPEPETRVVNGSPEGRELRQLIDNRSNVGEIFDAALGKRAVDGASAEIQKHYGLDVNQVPLAMLMRSWPTDGELETRAVTPAPGDVGQEQTCRSYPTCSPMSAASFLGISHANCTRSGEAVYPVLTSELSVKTPAENAEADETTGRIFGGRA